MALWNAEHFEGDLEHTKLKSRRKKLGTSTSCLFEDFLTLIGNPSHSLIESLK